MLVFTYHLDGDREASVSFVTVIVKVEMHDMKTDGDFLKVNTEVYSDVFSFYCGGTRLSKLDFIHFTFIPYSGVTLI